MANFRVLLDDVVQDLGSVSATLTKMCTFIESSAQDDKKIEQGDSKIDVPENS